MDENDVSYRVPCILVGCLLLDVILFVRYVWEPEDALIYLTSWSHIFSFLVRSMLLCECFLFVDERQYHTKICLECSLLSSE